MCKIKISDTIHVEAEGSHNERNNNKPVVRIDKTGGVKLYLSVTDAAEQNEGTVHGISCACNGKAKTYKKFRWMFFATYINNPNVSFECIATLQAQLDNANEVLAKNNAKLAEHETEMAEFRAWKEEQERNRKEAEELEQAIGKANAKIERRRIAYANAQERAQKALNRLVQAEMELEYLMNRKEN